MIKAGKKVIVVTDHTKIDRVSLHKVDGIEEFDTLITSKEIDHTEKENLQSMDINVCLV